MSESPKLSADQLTELADEIATFAARIDVATHALLTRLRTFDAHEAWGNSGFLSTAQWLAWRTHIGPTAARERVRVARALGELPRLDAAFSRGELSYSKVRAITRVATPASEQHWIDVAPHTTAAQIEQLTRAHKRVHDLRQPGELPRDQRRFVRRTVLPNGMVRFEAQFPLEEANVISEAIESAGEQLDHVPAETPEPPTSPDQPADAPAETPRPKLTPETRADALLDLARAYLRHRPRTLGSAYELVVVTTQELLADGREGVGGTLPDGTPVPLSVVQRIASDSPRVDVVVSERGEVLDVGRRTRAIPPAIARALWLRDGGCRVPGCGRKRHLHGHHIQAWAKGGPTKLSNLALVCSGHHRLIHEGQLGCKVIDGQITFTDDRGQSIPAAPPTAANGRDLEELELFLQHAGLRVDASLTEPKWDGTRMDLGEALAWMLMAEPRSA